VHPFDRKTALLAKHAQHVVLIHFPIALFITGVAFGSVARWTKGRGLAEAAYANPLAGAVSTLPVLATGILGVAVPTRGPEAERHPAAAPGAGLRFQRDDLAGMVGTFSPTSAWRGAARLPHGARNLGGCGHISDRASRRVSQWHQRAWLEATDDAESRQPSAPRSTIAAVMLRALKRKNRSVLQTSSTSSESFSPMSRPQAHLE
jgi:hypothetical protein